MQTKTESLLAAAFLLLGTALSSSAQEMVFQTAKYCSGDNKAWSRNDCDDNVWREIDVNREWTYQGVDNADAYGWYRIHLTLPSSMKAADPNKKALVIDLGFVDDCDETFFNGALVGKIGTMPCDPEGYESKYNFRRHYLVNPALIRWDKDNVIAVRVYNGGDPGGMFGGPVKVRMATISDLAAINFSEKGDVCHVELSSAYALKGNFKVEGIDLENGQKVEGSSLNVNASAKKAAAGVGIDCPYSVHRQIQWTATFTDSKSGQSASLTFIPKYILTPDAPASPRYNGPLVFGVRPGSPIIFRMPFSGERPMKFSVEGLPEGVTLDRQNGILGGSTEEVGDHHLTFVAENAHGTVRQQFTLKVGAAIALTPPMGWNSWNCWGLAVSQERVISSAQAILSKGLADYGYSYINIDDAWQADERDSDGTILANDRFPDIKGLGDWLHSNGLRLGIYSSPGDRTCGSYLGSLGHEKQDIETYNEWGVDYLKYDWCGYSREFDKDPDKSTASYVRPYLLMEQYIRRQPRDIFYSLCQYGMADVWKWGHVVDANSWRTTGDITDTWASLYDIGFVRQAGLAPYAQPGHWNDPDMLVVGKLGWSANLRDSRLTADEQYTHISLWALLASNLLIGCDVAQMDDFTLALLCNNEVNAINQDVLGHQASRDIVDGDIQVWSRPLADGGTAVGIFNLGEGIARVDIGKYLEKLGISGNVRDLWRQKDIPAGECLVAPHGVKLVKVTR